MSKVDDLKREEYESSEAFEELAALVAELVDLLGTEEGTMARGDEPNSKWLRFPMTTVSRFRQIREEWR